MVVPPQHLSSIRICSPGFDDARFGHHGTGQKLCLSRSFRTSATFRSCSTSSGLPYWSSRKRIAEGQGIPSDDLLRGDDILTVDNLWHATLWAFVARTSYRRCPAHEHLAVSMIVNVEKTTFLPGFEGLCSFLCQNRILYVISLCGNDPETAQPNDDDSFSSPCKTSSFCSVVVVTTTEAGRSRKQRQGSNPSNPNTLLLLSWFSRCDQDDWKGNVPL